jgi:WD40 repeat protein
MNQATPPLILLLGAKSTDKKLPSVPKELSAIKQLFNDKQSSKLLFQLEYEPYFTQSHLKKQLDRLANHVAILHFAGHSTATALQTDDKWVYSQHIATIIATWTIQPTLIFLNGCKNKQQVQLFLDAGVANIIATHKPINDQQASQFSLEFYTSLFSKPADVPLPIAFKRAGEKVFLDSNDQVRSFGIESLDLVSSHGWDWGLFEKYPSKEQQWTLQRLLRENRPRLDQMGHLINPYKGLESFKEEDKMWFFGRETLTQELAEVIQNDRFFTLLGASGSGKSSLINAAVIPHLRSNKNSIILQTTPANNPFEELAGVFCANLYPDSVTQQLKEQEALAALLTKQETSIGNLARSLLEKATKTKLYLCIDQFEELFTQSQPTIVQCFLQQLMQLINAKIECCLILIMRADFLASALENTEFTRLMDKYPHKLLAPMTKAEVRQAIEKPAQQQRITLEPSLLAALLDDIENQVGYLPLLQYSLELLWEQRQSTNIQLKDYIALGGLSKVLEIKANEIYEHFSAQQKVHCQHIFLRLIQIGEGNEDTRRRANLEEFNQHTNIQKTIKKLADARLITTWRNSGSKHAYAEISHEALIKHWSQLRQWIVANRDQLRTQNQLSTSTKEWKKRRYHPDWLLGGSQLVIAEEWLKNNKMRASTLEQKFIHQGIEERDKQTKTKEQQRKKNRNVLIGLIVMLSVIAIIALTQWQATQKVNKELKQKTLESNFFLAKSYEQKAIVALANGDKEQQKKGDKSLDHYRKAWLYALEAKKQSLEKNKIALKQTSLIKLTNLSARAISPEKKFPSSISLGFITDALVYSPNGKIIASASDDYHVRLWDAQSGQLKKVLKGHTKRVNTLAYSLNGNILASGSDDGKILFWDATSGQLQKILPVKSSVNTLTYHPDGKILASGSDDGNIQLWDAKSGQLKKTLPTPSKSGINTLIYRPDGKILASGSDNGDIQLWDTKSNQLKKTLPIKSSINVLTYHPYNTMLAAGLDNGNIQRWDTQSEQLKKPLTKHTESVYELLYSSDGKTLTSGSNDNSVRRWNTQSWESIRTINSPSSVMALAYSPDEKTLAFASDDRRIRLLDTQSESSEKNLNKHTHKFYSFALSPDKKTIASASNDHTVHLWDAQSGRLKQTFKDYSANVTALTYRPDGKVLAAGSGNNLQLRNIQTGQLIPSFKQLDGKIYSLAYHIDNKILAIGLDNKSIQLLDTQSGEVVKTFDAFTGRVNALAYHPDGKTIASGSGGILQLWDVQSGELIQTLNMKMKGYVSINALAYSHDGKMLASLNDNKVQLWDEQLKSNYQLKRTLNNHPHEISSLTFSPYDKELIATSPQGLRLWDTQSGALKQTLNGHTSGVDKLTYRPDGKVLASAANDKKVLLWDTQSRQVKKSFRGHGRGVTALTYSFDGKQLASASGLDDNNSMLIQDISSGVLLKSVKGYSSDIYKLAYHPDSNVLASASFNRLKLWDAQSGELQKTLTQYTQKRINALLYSPDGKTIASASDDKIIRLWDAYSGELKKPLEGHTGGVKALVYHPTNSKILASASGYPRETSDYRIHFWNTESGQFERTLEKHTENINKLAYSPDGKIIASASYDKNIILWDTTSRQLKHILKGHTDDIVALIYISDGKVLASASRDNSIRLWDVESGKLQQTLNGHTKKINALAYHPDSNVLASASEDHTIRLWDKNQFTTLTLFHDFDPTHVSDALKFLWELDLDRDTFEFITSPRMPSLYPLEGYYYSDVQFRPLLEMPKEGESKMDQLVGFLKIRCAYKDTEKAKACKEK